VSTEPEREQIAQSANPLAVANGPRTPITHFHAMLYAPSDDPGFISNALSGDAAMQAYAAAGVPSDDSAILGAFNR
jgi:hypothetical protein